MKIIVCVKQVLDTEELKVVDEKTGKIKEGTPVIVNPYDKNALEAAVQLKEKVGGHVTVISLGTEKAKTALKECVSVGADQAVLISDASFDGSDSYSTSTILAAAIKKLGNFDLILCGNQATDSDAGQVGPQVAELLDVTQLTYVSNLEVENDRLVAKRETEEGQELVEASLPAVCTVVDSMNEPRLATIKTKMAANKAKIEVLSASDLDLESSMIGPNSLTQVVKTFAPPKREAGLKIKEASGAESAQKLVETLVSAKLL